VNVYWVGEPSHINPVSPRATRVRPAKLDQGTINSTDSIPPSASDLRKANDECSTLTGLSSENPEMTSRSLCLLDTSPIPAVLLNAFSPSSHFLKTCSLTLRLRQHSLHRLEGALLIQPTTNPTSFVASNFLFTPFIMNIDFDGLDITDLDEPVLVRPPVAVTSPGTSDFMFSTPSSSASGGSTAGGGDRNRFRGHFCQ
jgi:hypothetical protein